MDFFQHYNAILILVPLVEKNTVIKSFSNYRWSLTTPGMVDHQGAVICSFYGCPLDRAKAAIAYVESAWEGVFVLEGIPELIKDADLPEQHELVAYLVDAVSSCSLGTSKKLALIDSHEVGLPSSLDSIIRTVFYPLPTPKQIGEFLRSRLPDLGDLVISWLEVTCSGLTIEEIKAVSRRRLTQENALDVFLQYKIERLRAMGLEFISKPDVGDFGGLDQIKKSTVQVSMDFSKVARDYKIPYPKGWLLAGVPGSGKTFCSQVVADKLGFPLISVGADVVKGGGALLLKRLLARIEACSPCVCFFDEFDKFFSAGGSSGEDKESKQILGVLLTWLQEKRSPTFVIATLNRLNALPPELTRSGRFDKIFYVGFPQANERKEIFQLHVGRFDPRWKSDETCPIRDSQWCILLNKTINCTGAEIRAIAEIAAKSKFYEIFQSTEVSKIPLDIELVDLLEARSQVTPLFSRDPERVLAMENQARYVAIPASSRDVSQFSIKVDSLWG